MKPRPSTSYINKKQNNVDFRNVSQSGQTHQIRSINIYTNKLRTDGTSQNILAQIKTNRGAYPRNILQDKETLYEDVWKLKEHINTLNDEIRRLKYANENSYRKIKQYEEIIQEKEKRLQKQQAIDSQQQSTTLIDSNLTTIINLKSQISEYQKQLNQKTNEVNQLKKNSRTTYVNEIEAENEELKNECKRLTLFIKAQNKQEYNEVKIGDSSGSEDPNQKIQTLLLTYKQDNIELSTMVAELEDKKKNNETKIRHLEHEIERLNYKLRMSDKQIKELNNHINFIRQDMGSANNPKKMGVKQENELLKKQLNQMRDERIQYSNDLIEAKQKIQDLERKLKDQELEYQIIRSHDNKEKEKLNDRITYLKRENDRLEKLLSRDAEESYSSEEVLEQTEVKQSSNANISLKHQRSIVYSPTSPVQLRKDSKNVSQVESMKNTKITKRKLPKVNQYDVTDICKELKIRLINSKVEFQLIDNLIIAQGTLYDDNISTQQVQEALKRPPFLIDNSETLQLLSRYLVEDNQEEFVIFDVNRTQEKSIVKSVFKKMIGTYQLFSDAETEQLDVFFANLIMKWCTSFESALKQILAKKKMAPGICEYQDIEGAFAFCDVTLQPRQREYFDIQTFQDTQSLKLINYQGLFEKYIKYYRAYHQRLEQERIEKEYEQQQQQENAAEKEVEAGDINIRSQEDRDILNLEDNEDEQVEINQIDQSAIPQVLTQQDNIVDDYLIDDFEEKDQIERQQHLEEKQQLDFEQVNQEDQQPDVEKIQQSEQLEENEKENYQLIEKENDQIEEKEQLVGNEKEKEQQEEIELEYQQLDENENKKEQLEENENEIVYQKEQLKVNQNEEEVINHSQQLS